MADTDRNSHSSGGSLRASVLSVLTVILVIAILAGAVMGLFSLAAVIVMLLLAAVLVGLMVWAVKLKADRKDKGPAGT